MTALHPGTMHGRESGGGERVVGWMESRRNVLVVGFAILVAFATVLLILRKSEPRIVLEAKSHAVVFVPSRAVELVGSAAPRHGLEPGGRPFTGIRFTPRLPNDEAFRAFAGTVVAAKPESVHALQRLEVTVGCAVRLEHYVDDLIRVDVESLVGGGDTCRMSADVTLADASGFLPVEVGPRSIKLGAPATLIFQPAHPLQLRDLPVSALRFETSDTGLVRSAILNARLELPDVAQVGGNAPTARLGDAVTLGDLKGTITELVVRDTIRTLFKGTASRPAIARRDLRPPMLEHLGHTHWRLGIAFVAVGLGLLAHFLPKARS